MALSCEWNSSPTLSMRHGSSSKKNKKPAVSVMLLGSPDAGKGGLLHAYTEGRYPDTERPEHKRVVSIVTFNDSTIKVCDTPGNIDLASSKENQKKKKHRGSASGPVGLVAVYSVEDRASLDEAVKVLEGHLQAGSNFHGMALVGTWNGARPNGRKVTHKQGRDAAQQVGATFCEVACCQETRLTIQAMVRKLAEVCLNEWTVQSEKCKNIEKDSKAKSSYRVSVKSALRSLKSFLVV